MNPFHFLLFNISQYFCIEHIAFIMCKQINPAHTMNKKMNLMAQNCEDEKENYGKRFQQFRSSVQGKAEIGAPRWELLGSCLTMQYNPECMHYLPCLISASYEIVMHLSFLITEFFQVLIIGFFSQRSFLFYTGNNISTLCKVRKILKVIRKRGKMPASSIGLPF